MTSHVHWQSLAVGVSLVGIVAYFLWTPATPASVAVQEGAAPPDVNKADGIPGLPSYLTVNRPGYTVAPTRFPDLIQWANPSELGSGLVLPDGLYRARDGSIRGGNYVGGNYVGGRVSIVNPAVMNVYDAAPQSGVGTIGVRSGGCC